MAGRNKSNTRDRHKGQSFLELAIVLPLLLLVVFGVLDLGRVFFSTITLVNAAREGARYLTVYPDDVSNSDFARTKWVTRQEAAGSGITLTQVDVVCTNGGGGDEDILTCDSGYPAVVTVTHNFDLVLGWALPSPITIIRSAEMVVP
jgi:Flp pilus assembly protein TadG